MVMESVIKEVLFLSLLAFSHLLIKSNSLVEENSVRCGRLKPVTTKDRKLKQRCDNTKETVYFGLMLSFPDAQRRPSFTSSFDDGHDIAPAAYLAVKQVNNRSDLLRDYEIKLLRLDGGCDVHGRTVIGFNELVCSNESIVGIIGPSCERSSRTVNQLTNREDFSMITINYGGQNARTDEYSYAFGILGSKSTYSMAYVELIKYNNWTNYALLYSGTNHHYSNLGRELLNITTMMGIPPTFTSSIYKNFIPLREVKASFSRVIIIIDSPRVILRTLCLAFHEGVVFPSYQWVFQGTVSQNFYNTSFVHQGKVYNCSESEINTSLNGSINFFLNILQDNRDMDTLPNDDYYDGYELETNFYSKRFGVPSKTTEWAKGFYDAVWALAYALNSSLADLNTSLTYFKLGSPVLAESIKSHMFDLEFHGVTGIIKFVNNTGFNEEGFLSMLQYAENKTSTKVGVYKDRQIKISSNISSASIFINSIFKEQFIHVHIEVAAGIFVITVVTLILLISAQIVNVRYRNHKAIKASSPNFNHMIFIGGYLIVIGIVLFIVENIEQISAISQLHFCNFVPFLFTIGITLFLGTSCTKTWRLNRIYVHSKKYDKEDIKSIKSYVLVGFVCVLVAIDLLVCTLWRSIDPLTPTQTQTLNMEGSDGPVMIVDNVCHSTYEAYWLIALVVPKVLVTFVSLLLALSTQINIKEFKTRLNNVIAFTYCLTVIFGLAIPLYAIIHFTSINISISVGVLSTSLNLSIWVCVIILILPLIKSTCTLS